MEKRKHFPFEFYDIQEEKFIKEKASYYKSKSPLHYEAFKRTITLYKLCGDMNSVLDFKCNFTDSYDTVNDTLFKHKFKTIFHFEKRFLDPQITSRKEYEIELGKYLARRKRRL